MTAASIFGKTGSAGGANHKSRTLMFLALDKLQNQAL
jgi:hypothetical protein